MANQVSQSTRKSVTARNEALKRFIGNHEDEYKKILAEERIKLGMDADPEAAKLQARIDKKRKELEELTQRAEARRVTTTR